MSSGSQKSHTEIPIINQKLRISYSNLLFSFFYLAAPTTTTTVITTTTSPPCISSLYTSYMSQYSVIAFQSLKTTSNIGYKTIVCGNLLGGAMFASQLDQNTFNPLDYSLEINGSTAAGNTTNIISGSVALGPYPSNRFVLKTNTNNQYRIDNQIDFTLNQGNQGATVQMDPTLPDRCAEIISGIQYLSTSLSQLSPNNDVTIPSTQPGPLYFNVNSVDVNGIAVFNVSANAVFNNNNVQSIALVSQNTNLQFAVINVYGANVSWSGVNLVGNWFRNATTGQSHTIWNFYEATVINFGSDVEGAVLAPYAAVTTESNISGSIAVQSLDAGGEVHLPLVVFPNCTSTSSTTSGQSTTGSTTAKSK